MVAALCYKYILHPSLLTTQETPLSYIFHFFFWSYQPSNVAEVALETLPATVTLTSTMTNDQGEVSKPYQYKRAKVEPLVVVEVSREPHGMLCLKKRNPKSKKEARLIGLPKLCWKSSRRVYDQWEAQMDKIFVLEDMCTEEDKLALVAWSCAEELRCYYGLSTGPWDCTWSPSYTWNGLKEMLRHHYHVQGGLTKFEHPSYVPEVHLDEKSHSVDSGAIEGRAIDSSTRGSMSTQEIGQELIEDDLWQRGKLLAPPHGTFEGEFPGESRDSMACEFSGDLLKECPPLKDKLEVHSISSIDRTYSIEESKGEEDLSRGLQAGVQDRNTSLKPPINQSEVTRVEGCLKSPAAKSQESQASTGEGTIVSLRIHKEPCDHISNKLDLNIQPTCSIDVDFLQQVVGALEEEEGTRLAKKPICINQTLEPTFKAILKKHGDITRDCPLESGDVLASVLEVICVVVEELQKKRLTEVDCNRLSSYYSVVRDAEKMKLNVDWLRTRLDEIKDAVTSIVETKKLHDEKSKRVEQIENDKKELELVKVEFETLKGKVERKESFLSLDLLVIGELSNMINRRALRMQQLQNMTLMEPFP